ncbi:hypothetical protein SLS60_006767 [Paraconiothyrium brasiliense]|uniref:Uncharacterized protein n=1 Tax=Paraconiothyrium brasiliense TaxID=300254 RepID=A0ABR3R7Q1_9PLEO
MQSSPFTLGCSPGQGARMPVTNANTNTARIMQGSSAFQSGLSQSSGRKSQFLAILEEARADDTAVVVDVTAANASGLSLKAQIREAEKKLRSIMETLNSNLYYSFYLRKAHLSLDKLNEVVETQKALVRQHSGLVAADHLVVLKAVCKRAEGFLVHFQQYEAKYKRDKSRISDDQMQFVDWVHKEHSSPCESSSYDLVTKVISENRGMGIPTVVGRNGERQFPYISSDDRIAMKSLILQSIMRIDNGILVEDITGRRLSQTQRQKAKASLEQSAYESTKLEGSEAYRSHVKRILEDKEAEAKDDRATFYQWLASLGVHEQDSLVGKPVQVLNGRFAGNRGTVVMEYEDGKLHVYWNSEIHEDIHSSDIERISAEQTSQFTLPPITPGSKPPAATSVEDAQDSVDENPSTAGPLNDGLAIGYLDSHMSGTEIGPVSSGNQNTGSGTLNDVPTSFALPQAQNDSDPAPENEDMKDVEISAPAVNLSPQTPFLAFTTTNVPLINTSSLTVGPTAGLGPQPLLPIGAPSQHGPAPLPAQDTFGPIEDTEMGGYSNGEDDTAVVSPEDTASSREIEMSVSDGEEPDNMETDNPEEVPEEVGSMETDNLEEVPEEVGSIEIDNSESHTIPKLPQNVLPGYNCLTSQKPQARDTEGNAHLEYPQTPVTGSNAIDVVAKPTAAAPTQGAVTVEDKNGIEMAILEQAVSALQGFRSTQNDSESNTDDEQNNAHDDEANVNTQSFCALKHDASPSDTDSRSSDGIPSTTDGHVPTDMGVFYDRTIYKEPAAPTEVAAQQAGAGSTTANTSQGASSANFESSEVASPRKVPTNQDRQRSQGGNSQSKDLDEPQALAAKDGKDEFPPPAAIMPSLQEGRRTINAATSRNSQRASRRNTDRKKTRPSSMFFDREPLPGGGYRLVFQAGAREPSYVEHHPQKTRKYGNDVSSADFSAEYHAVRAVMAIGEQGSSTSISGPFITSSISLTKNPFPALHVPISSYQKEQTQAVKEDVDVQVPIYKPAVIGTFLSNAGSANVGQQAITRESTDSSRSCTDQSRWQS